MRGGALQAERRAAADAVEKIPELAAAWFWERDAAAGPYSSEDVCLGQAATSDGLVLIVADELTPITRREFEVARERGVPVYLLIDQRVEMGAELAAFVEAQQSEGLVTKGFRTIGELETHVVEAVTAYAVRAVRIVNHGTAAERKSR